MQPKSTIEGEGMNLSTLTKAQKMALGGGALLLLASFLPWYAFGPFGVIGWGAGLIAWLGILAGVAGAAVVGLKGTGQADVKAGPLAAEQVGTILAGLGTALILLRLLTASGLASFGLFLGLAGAALATFGAFRAMREAGLELPIEEARRRLEAKEPGPPPEEFPGGHQ
ncbi:MAG: hypothetical protein ACRDXD_08330 [Acidimicrobiia bacterium]